MSSELHAWRTQSAEKNPAIVLSHEGGGGEASGVCGFARTRLCLVNDTELFLASRRRSISSFR